MRRGIGRGGSNVGTRAVNALLDRENYRIIIRVGNSEYLNSKADRSGKYYTRISYTRFLNRVNRSIVNKRSAGEEGGGGVELVFAKFRRGRNGRGAGIGRSTRSSQHCHASKLVLRTPLFSPRILEPRRTLEPHF